MLDSTYAEYFEHKYSKSVAISHRDYLAERCHNRRLYIYGTGDVAIGLETYLKLNGIVTSAFVDDDTQERIIDNTHVIQSIDLVYMDINDYFVIVAKENESYGISREKFINMGLMEDINFTYHTEIPGTNELFHYDVTLSFNRIRQKYEGFEVFGNESDQSAIRIVALGGSTTECSLFYVKGWVYFLAEYLNKMKIPAVVYCGGVSSYTSSQELLKLIRDVIPLQPDIVISYSGVNDLYSFPKIEEEYRFRRPFITKFQVQFIRQVLERLTNKIGIPVVNAPSWDQTGHNTVFYGVQNDKTASEFWIDNERIMNAICQEFGIVFLSFYQPFRFNGSYKCTRLQEIIHSRRDLTCVPTSEGEKRWGLSVKTEHEKIVSEIKKYEFINDLSSIFLNESEVYYDTTHVYEKGNKIIAKKILEKIFPCINGVKRQKKYISLNTCFVNYLKDDNKTDISKKMPMPLNAINYFVDNSKHKTLDTKTIKPGDTIVFGKYSWLVLELTDTYILVISEKVIERREYHDSLTSITWEDCELRKWLNTYFFYSFSVSEQERILPALVLNQNNSIFDTAGGKNTVDKIFILSADEFEKYLLNNEHKIGYFNNKPIWWWLRTPGIYSDRVMVIHEDGHVIVPGYYVKQITIETGTGVRPAMLLKL